MACQSMADCPFDPIVHADVRTIAATVGIELRGDDGQPWHCGARMQVKSGIVGTDYARCEACGLTVGNILSPHINGGYVMADPIFEAHGDGQVSWSVLAPARSPEPVA